MLSEQIGKKRTAKQRDGQKPKVTFANPISQKARLQPKRSQAQLACGLCLKPVSEQDRKKENACGHTFHLACVFKNERK